MSILGTIMSKVLGKAPASPAAAAPAAPSAQASGTTNAAPSAPAPTSSSAPLGPSVDVAAVLDALSDKKLRSSIGDTPAHSLLVDLINLLSVDSSLLARKELAKELHYDGDTNNSTSMDIWLHKQIMVILAANGGKLPNDLRRKWYLSHYGP